MSREIILLFMPLTYKAIYRVFTKNMIEIAFMLDTDNTHRQLYTQKNIIQFQLFFRQPLKLIILHVPALIINILHQNVSLGTKYSIIILNTNKYKVHFFLHFFFSFFTKLNTYLFFVFQPFAAEFFSMWLTLSTVSAIPSLYTTSTFSSGLVTHWIQTVWRTHCSTNTLKHYTRFSYNIRVVHQKICSQHWLTPLSHQHIYGIKIKVWTISNVWI